jgi:TRAP-type transport system periplasmic protein
MKLLRITAIMIMIGTMALTGAFASGQAETAADSANFRMGLMEQENSASGEAAGRFAELVEEYTDGRYTVDVFYDGALGETGDAIEGVIDGSIQLWWNGISWYENFADDFRIFSVNWAFDDNDHLARFFETDRFQVDMKDQLRDLNLEMIGYEGYRNPRNVLSAVPVEGNEDLEGLLIRTPPQTMYVRSWQAVGANPTQMDYGEVYTALRQGAIEAMENPIDSIHAQSFQEVASHYVLTQHLLNPYAIVMNLDAWDRLSDADKEVFLQAAQEAGHHHASIVGEVEDKIRQEWIEDYDITFVEMDIPALAENMRPLAEEMEADGQWSEGLFDYVRSLSE